MFSGPVVRFVAFFIRTSRSAPCRGVGHVPFVPGDSSLSASVPISKMAFPRHLSYRLLSKPHVSGMLDLQHASQTLASLGGSLYLLMRWAHTVHPPIFSELSILLCEQEWPLKLLQEVLHVSQDSEMIFLKVCTFPYALLKLKDKILVFIPPHGLKFFFFFPT